MSDAPKILIVDDDPTVLLGIREFFVAGGYFVESHLSGGEALEAFDAVDFDAVILDIVMPEMGGYQLMARLQDRRPDVPVVVITGYATIDATLEALRKRAYDFLVKPLDFGRLGRIVDRAVRYRNLARERDRAIRDLRASEARLRTLFDEAPDAILIADPETGTLADANAAAAHLFGMPREEIIGMHQSELHPQEAGEVFRTRFRAHMDQVMHGRDVDPVEIPILRRGGERRQVEIMARPVHIKDRPYVQGIFRDVSKRKLVEDRLQETTSLLSTLMDAIPNPIFYKDAKGRYLGCNRAFERELGVGKEEIRGKTVFEIAPLQLAMGYRRRDLELLATRGVQRYQSTVRFADAGLREVIFYKATFDDSHGEVAGIVGVMVDLTDVEEMKRALELSEQKYRTLFEEVPVGIGIADLDGRIIETNRSAMAITGYGPDDFRRINVSETYVDPNERTVLLERLQRRGRVRDWEVTLRRKDGEAYPALLNVDLLEMDGGRRLLTTIRDITEIKRAQAGIEAALREKEVLLREIHHRVKNNLTVITSLIDMQVDSLADEGMIRTLKGFRERVMTMAYVHEDLYRSDSLAAIDLNAYFRRIIEDLTVIYGPNRLRLDLDLCEIRETIEVALPCGLIITELLSNAFKYAFPPSRAAGAEACRIRVGFREAGNRFVLEVADNGVGIAGQPAGGQGATLGFRLVSILARQLHGSVEQVDDGGLSVSVTFPRPAPRAPFRQSGADAERSTGSK